jgi:hypothetical protein
VGDTSLVFNIIANDQASRKLRQLRESLSGLGGALAGVGLAVGGAELVRFGMDAIKAASDLNETRSKAQQVFGPDAAAEIVTWSKTASTALGQSQQSALDAATTFAIYGKTATLTGESLVDFSTRLTKLSTDMASFSNTSPQEAVDALGSALRGEYDPIEKYGVLLNEATVKNVALEYGIVKTTKNALTPQQRVLAVYDAILQQTSDSQGDFERTSKGAANQARIMAARFEDAKAALGQKLLPAVAKLAEILNSQVIPAFISTVHWVKENQAWVAPLAVGLGTLGAAIGVVIVATKIWTAVQTALDIAMMANPIGLVVLAVVALAAGIYYAWTHSETFRKVIITGWGAIVAFFKGVWSWLVNFFTVDIPNWWHGLVSFVTGLPGMIGSAISNFVSMVVNGLTALPGFLWNLFATGLANLAYIVGYGLGLVLKFFIDLPANVWHLIVWLWTTSAQLTGQGVEWVVNFVASLPGRVWAVVSALPGILWNIAKTAWSLALSATKAGVQWLITEAMALPGRLWNLGTSIVDGLVNGVKNAAGKLWDLAKNMAHSFLKGFKDALGISSPSRVFQEEVAPNIAAGLVIGLQGQRGAVADAGADLAAGVRPAGAAPFPVAGRSESGPAGGQSVTVQFVGFSGADDDFLRIVRKAIRVNGLALT